MKKIIFIEGNIRQSHPGETLIDELDIPQLQARLHLHLSKKDLTYELLEDILGDQRSGRHRLGTDYDEFRNILLSLRVVEYLGPKTEVNCYSTNEVELRIQLYQLYDTPRSLQENLTLPQAEITLMPHTRFSGGWDDLVFEDDIKGDLIWMMTNILRFSQRQTHKSGEMSPLILLYGPPGTGKTSLCQGLAQKISIRLSGNYHSTKLVEIKTATLLSKFYSESARQVDEIFTKIARMCQEDPNEFICILIDEVESIANSRESSNRNGESQDSLRATNALLTGLDRTRSYPNVMFLCTSNMYEALDLAFLDRCGLKRAIGRPSFASQYEILRSRIQMLIGDGVIKSIDTIPSYDDAVLQVNSTEELPGRRLYKIVGLVTEVSDRNKQQSLYRPEISGRSLVQLPEQAILRYLREDECTLEMAFNFMERLVVMVDSEKAKDNAQEHKVESRGQKRKVTMIFEGDFDVEIQDHSATRNRLE